MIEVGGQRRVATTLRPGDKPRYALNRMLRGPKCRSGRFGEDKNLLQIVRTKIIQSHNNDNDDDYYNKYYHFSENTVEDCG
jgi:hypothetical protein